MKDLNRPTPIERQCISSRGFTTNQRIKGLHRMVEVKDMVKLLMQRLWEEVNKFQWGENMLELDRTHIEKTCIIGKYLHCYLQDKRKLGRPKKHTEKRNRDRDKWYGKHMKGSDRGSIRQYGLIWSGCRLCPIRQWEGRRRSNQRTCLIMVICISSMPCCGLHLHTS